VEVYCKAFSRSRGKIIFFKKRFFREGGDLERPSGRGQSLMGSSVEFSRYGVDLFDKDFISFSTHTEVKRETKSRPGSVPGRLLH
jgi:hypothetical protein